MFLTDENNNAISLKQNQEKKKQQVKETSIPQTCVSVLLTEKWCPSSPTCIFYLIYFTFTMNSDWKLLSTLYPCFWGLDWLLDKEFSQSDAVGINSSYFSWTPSSDSVLLLKLIQFSEVCSFWTVHVLKYVVRHGHLSMAKGSLTILKKKRKVSDFA